MISCLPGYDSFVILKSDGQYISGLEDVQYWDLRGNDLLLVNELLLSKPIANNNKTVAHYFPKETLSQYKFQYVPYLNEKGEHIVFVNAFCKENDTWKEKLVVTSDGSDCFWQVKINIDQQHIFDFRVNSVS